jgi:glycosyltransferase involved in cell wall biosynthesis
MKILQVITLSELGGAQSVLIELANNLANLGHDVTVISNPNGAMWDLFDKKIKTIKCQYFKREISPLNDLKSILFLSKIIKQNNYSAIHLHSSKAGVWGRLAGFKISNRIIYTVHGFDTIIKANKIFLILEKILAKRAKYLIPVSMYDEINLKKYHIKNIKMIYNGIKDILSESDYIKNPFVLHRNKEDKVIVTIARLQKPKNIKLFLDVARKLGSIGYAFYWIGNQEKVYDVPYNTFFLGSIPNAKYYLKFADLFVLFSNYEGLPISIIEAFASGIPVVASKVGGIPEMINGENGIAVDNNTDDAIKAILKLTRDNNKKARDASRDTYLQKFTIENMVSGYLEIYNEIYKGN